MKALLAGVMLVAAAVSAAAQRVVIDLPAGPLRQQVLALGRVARISITVSDAALWSRPMPRLRGPQIISAALHALARNAGATLKLLGPGSWRLAPRRTARAIVLRPPCSAAPAEPVTGPEVVVMASKRDTPRGRFPGQVARVDGRDLEFGGAGGTERLADRVTTIASTYLGAGRNKLFIRGIADSSFTGPTQATVGQYFGDLRLSYNAPDPDLRLVDLAAVEVLAGPQGTLYGAGSLVD